MSKFSKTSFEDLRVYQLAEQLADEVWQITVGWSSFAQDTIGKQLIRSAGSVGANIAEGVGRFNYKDNSRFIKIARGSLYETKHWLRRAYKAGLLKPEQTEKLKILMEELFPKLNAYLRATKQSSNNKHSTATD